ncbi:MAG: NAD-binding protein [Bacteroidota bacterium]|nr:NAD-binding protein [Bacteroidota bacterium]
MKQKGISKENFKSVYIAIGLLIIVVTTGISGFIVIEDFTFIEAFFMTIITISTVGFREIHPLSEIGQVFTAFLIVSSFGIFAYAVTTITRYIVDGVFRNYLKDNKVKKRIEKLQNHVIVCGYGRNGRQAVEELHFRGFTPVIIDSNIDIINNIREETDFLYIHGNAAEDEVLNEAQILKAKALITALPNDADNLFVVLSAKDINRKLTIISRASKFSSIRKLKRAGATNIIMPDRIGGQKMAKLVAHPDVVEFLDYIMLNREDEVFIEEISCDGLAFCFAEKTIGEWNVRSISGANIVGMKTADNSYVVNPSPDVKITSKDQLFVLGTPYQISQLKNALKND